MKNKIITYSFISFLLLFMILGIGFKDKEISYQERRKLATFPEIGSSFFTNLDSYLSDQFPFRDSFRKIKGYTSNIVFRQKLSHNVFTSGNYLFQLDSSINDKSVTHLLDKIKYIDDTYLTNQNVYFSMIPDKNYYLDEQVPKLDYNRLESLLKNNLPSNIDWIDLKDTLSLDSYYYTDIHWKQEKLEPVVRRLQNMMNLTSTNFPTVKNEYYPFYGALYSRVASSINADTITYLTNSSISDAVVYNYEKKEIQPVYNKNYLNNVDSYDIFLSGATPLLIINNNSNNTGRELILFRDSFGSSLSPLLIDNYSKITIIDLRYINSKLLSNISNVTFNTATDVLFLYSIPIINNSFTLK